jgi:hypothetical protein
MADQDTQAKQTGTEEEASRTDKEQVSIDNVSFTMDKRLDLAFTLFFVFFGALVLFTARNIRSGSIPDPITTKGMPNLAGISLIIIGIILVVQQLRRWSELPGHLVPEEGQEDEKGYPPSWIRAASIILLSFVWAAFLNSLGFLIITPLCLFVGALFMGERKWVQIVLFSIIFSISIWVIFGPLLGIRFPLGPLSHVVQSLIPM